MKIKISKHNLPVVEKIVDSYHSGTRSILYTSGVGTGKSYVFMGIVERMLQEDEKEAQKKIHSMDKKRDSYFGYYAGQDWKACHTYDLAISTSALGIDKAVDLICQYIELKFK